MIIENRIDEFMNLYNQIEGLLKKLYIVNSNQSVVMLYIKDIPEPQSSRMNTLRCARNMYVHGTKFNNEALISINQECLNFLRERISDIHNRVKKTADVLSTSERKEATDEMQDSAVDKYEYKERELRKGEIINKIIEFYSLYGWQFDECRGLDDLDGKTIMKFKRNKTTKEYSIMENLWSQRQGKIDKLNKIDKHYFDDNKNGKRGVVKKAMVTLISIIVYMLLIGLVVLGTSRIINLEVGTVIKVALAAILYIAFISVIFILPKILTIKNKKVNQIAEEINSLDNQAKNIIEYLK